MIAIGYMATAQELVKTYAAEYAFKKDALGIWKWKKRKACNVVFEISGDIIKTNDKSHSVYTTYKTLTITDREALWMASDENNRECTVKIEFGNEDSYITITYPNACYKYIFKS